MIRIKQANTIQINNMNKNIKINTKILCIKKNYKPNLKKIQILNQISNDIFNLKIYNRNRKNKVIHLNQKIRKINIKMIKINFHLQNNKN